MLMMFNMLITFVGIFVYSLNEIDTYPQLLLKYPAQLKYFRQRGWPNFYSVIRSILFGLFNAFVLFFFTMWFYGNGGMNK